MTPLTMILHGEPGSGKSSLALSGPGPRLIIDAESGAHHAHRVIDGDIELAKTVRWVPEEVIPEVEDTCIVSITSYNQMVTVLDRLQEGNHPFRTIILDSITEIQQRLHDAIRTERGREQFQQADWGTSKTRLTTMVREFRDLSVNPSQTVPVVVFIALTKDKPNNDGRIQKWPNLEGGAVNNFPGTVDVVGFTSIAYDGEAETEQQGLLLHGNPAIIAKTRSPLVRMNWGSVVVQPNLERIWASIQTKEND